MKKYKILLVIIFLLIAFNSQAQSSIKKNTTKQQQDTVKKNPEELKAVEIYVTKNKSNINTQVFTVDENLISAGGTAIDLLKSIPMISVDIDGNPTLRNASPQILIDGNPTTLTLDQISNDLIDRVEVITNPSGKFSAEGQGGILNIILKQNTAIGFNLQARAGSFVYMKPLSSKYTYGDLYHYNYGLLLSYTNKKFSTNLNFIYNNRVNNGMNHNERTLLNTKDVTDITNINQDGDNISANKMYNTNFSFAYFLTKKHTLTLNLQGLWADKNSENVLNQEYIYSNNQENYNLRSSKALDGFTNFGVTLIHRVEIKKSMEEFNTMIRFNKRGTDNTNNLHNQYFTTYDDFLNNTSATQLNQLNLVTSSPTRIQAKTDYFKFFDADKENKIEMGLNFSTYRLPSDNNYYRIADDNSRKVLNSNKYDYSDYTFAGYVNYVKQISVFTISGGLRLERFLYTAQFYNLGNTQGFEFVLPTGLFPNLSLGYSFNDKNIFQISYSQRINRPSIFNLIPVTDYTDSTNLRRGNPDLKPERIHIAEINYQYTTKNHYFLSAIYFKSINNAISQYQILEPSVSKQNYSLVNTFVNSNFILSYGLELVGKNKFTIKNLNIDFASNFNIYNTQLNGGANYTDINRQRWAYYFKESISLRLSKTFSAQIFLEYQSEKLLPPSSSNRSDANNQAGGGQRSLSLDPSMASQGYVLPNYGMDLAFKKSFYNESFFITVTINDIFATKRYQAQASSINFEQYNRVQRNQRYCYITLIYKFKKSYKNEKTEIEHSFDNEPDF